MMRHAHRGPQVHLYVNKMPVRNPRTNKFTLPGSVDGAHAARASTVLGALLRASYNSTQRCLASGCYKCEWITAARARACARLLTPSNPTL